AGRDARRVRVADYVDRRGRGAPSDTSPFRGVAAPPPRPLCVAGWPRRPPRPPRFAGWPREISSGAAAPAPSLGGWLRRARALGARVRTRAGQYRLVPAARL